MLFNSYIFIFVFLPAALAGFFVAARHGRTAASVWLVLASLTFYGFWNPQFLIVLMTSIIFNYGMSAAVKRTEAHPKIQTVLLGGAVAANLCALLYYKYLFSIVTFFHSAHLIQGSFNQIALPLGISFFTFTQIGYLIDVKQGVAKDRGFLAYSQFVTFFPHLIAGPILHNKEMMPQFSDPDVYKLSPQNLAIGGTIFAMGLVKKCVLADPVGVPVSGGFAHAASLPMLTAWEIALSYSLQLYFDFSGYSDMAIGLARMFNIRFPLNFDSPYKSACIIEYWQRWHMTLTRYLNLYLYNPIALAITRWRIDRGLPTTRKGYATIGGFSSMVMLPTFITMTLAGIWHGAGLQFLVFGLLHAVYLTINHAWRTLFPRRTLSAPVPAGRLVGYVLLTYLAVLVASIFFRAPSCQAAVDLLAGMAGLRGIGAMPDSGSCVLVTVLYMIVWGFPNTQQIMRRYEPALEKIHEGPMPWLRWQISVPWACIAGLGVLIGIVMIRNSAEFLYFQF